MKDENEDGEIETGREGYLLCVVSVRDGRREAAAREQHRAHARRRLRERILRRVVSVPRIILRTDTDVTHDGWLGRPSRGRASREVPSGSCCRPRMRAAQRTL